MFAYDIWIKCYINCQHRLVCVLRIWTSKWWLIVIRPSGNDAMCKVELKGSKLSGVDGVGDVIIMIIIVM